MILTIQESGLNEIRAGFRRLEGAVSDLRGAWPAVSRYFHEVEEEAYRTEGGSQGRKWAPLSDRYNRRKMALFARRPILYLSGALKDSLTGVSGSRSISERLRYTEESMVPYAIHHATGTLRMPQRKPVSLTEGQAREIGAIVGREVQKDIRKGFSRAVPV